jgi:hypothetical protein
VCFTCKSVIAEQSCFSKVFFWIEPVTPSSMEFNNKVFLLWRHAPMLEARVEVVDPPEAAALACPVEAYMAIDKVMQHHSWLETMRLHDVCFYVARIAKKWLPNLKVSHPSNLRLWQRNPSGDHRTGGQCIPVAGPPALSMAPCASHLAQSPSLALFASTLDGLGTSLVVLPPLCASGLQFQV